MKSIKLKLLIIVLMMLSCAFLLPINKTKAIYREVKTTTLNLTISDAYTVQFDSRGGTSVQTRYIQPNDPVGTLPIPTKTGSNFAGWYDSNNQRVRHSTLITADTQLHAEWTDVICKRVIDENDLHTETCLTNGGCTKGSGIGLNNPITYGSVGDLVPVAGDAYNCDVDYDGTFDAKESDNKTFIERFYFVRSKANSGFEDSAVMYYSTSYDDHGRDPRTQSNSDIDSVDYLTAETFLPTSSEWDNPGIIDLDGNGKVSRFVSIDDMESVCGTIVTGQTSYFATCGKWFWFENTRFQAKALGRAGIWMEYPGTGTTYYRIHTESFNIGTVEDSSLNMARPVIEIPMSALEGYYDEDRFTISFSTYNNDPDPIDGVKRYRGEEIGSLPTPTRSGYTFVGWCTDPSLQNPVDPTALVSGNMTLYADWVSTAVQTVTVTLHLNDGTISGVTSPITMDSGDLLDDLPDPTKTGNAFLGWYLDGEFSTPFDDTQPITTDIDLYAKWGNYDARIGNDYYTTLDLAINAVLEGTSSKTTVTVLRDITRTSKVTIPSNKWVELDLQSYTLSANSGNLIENSGILNIINGTYVNTYSGNSSGQVIINNNGATLNISGGTLFHNNTAATEATLRIVGGTVNITGGRLETNAQAAVINVYGGTLNVSGGEIVSTGTIKKAQAIYMENKNRTPIVNISGNVYIENSTSTSTDQRAAVDNNSTSGVLTITGGTIVSKNYYGVANRSTGTTIIGIDDNGGNVIDSTAPIIRGKTHALYHTNGTLSVFDGEFKGTTGAADGTITLPNNVQFVNVDTETIDGTTYNIYHLNSTSSGPYTVTFNDGTTTTTVQVQNGSTIDAQDMPQNPTNAGHIFLGWFKEGTQVQITTSLPIYENITAVPKWKETVIVETITPSSITINKGSTQQISISATTQGNTYENVTYSTSDSSVATVDANGLVTAVGEGTATIILTGVDSGEHAYVSVTVNVQYHTVTFDKADGSQNPTSTIQVEHGTQIGGQMPQNPTRTGYIFVGWYDADDLSESVSSSNQIDDDLDAIAVWKESVKVATITPNPMTLTVGSSQQISITATGSGGTAELATFASAATSIVTVTSSGLVTAQGAGSTTITVTGLESHDSVTINVTVNPAPVQYTVTFDTDGGSTISPIPVNAGETLGINMPQDPTKADNTFMGWYNQDFSETRDENTVIDSDMTFYAKWMPDDAVCEMNGVYYSSVQEAVNAAPAGTDAAHATKTTIKLLKDVNVTKDYILNMYDTTNGANSDNYKKNIVLDMDGHWFKKSSSVNSNYYIMRTKGILEMKNGYVEAYGGKGALEAGSGGTLILNNMFIEAKGNRQGVYNDGGTIYITGGSEVIAKAQVDSSNKRATVQNVNGGTTYIQDATITSSTGIAVASNNGTFVIGEKDDIYDTSKITIRGAVNGIYSTVNYSIYDGTIIGPTGAVVNDESKINGLEDNAVKQNGTTTIDQTQYQTLYYTIPSGYYTIEFDADGGNVSPDHLDFILNQQIDISLFPEPTKTDNTFDGWYIDQGLNNPAVSFIPTVADTVTYYAKWVSNTPPETYTITLNPNGGSVGTSSVTVTEGNAVDNLPVPTRGVYTFDGWYTAQSNGNLVEDGVTIPTQSTTYYAMWSYTSSTQVKTFTGINPAIDYYQSKIASWKNSSSNFPTWSDQNKASTNFALDATENTVMLQNFNNNNCECTSDDVQCYSSGTVQCDKPVGYDIGDNVAFNVYLYDETNQTVGAQVAYAKATNGVIYNLIPNQAYYWEKASDTTMYGVVKYTGTRRILNTGDVRNARDLGGLSVDTNNDGTPDGYLKYGRLYRGIKLKSSSSVTELTNLGINSQLDLRESNSDANKLSRYNRVEAQNYYVNPLTTTNPAHTPTTDETNYYNMTRAAVKFAMQEIVAGKNLYFHCRIGTDRTGTVAYVLEGLLGVPEEERIQDYELSFFYGLVRIHRYHDQKPGSNVGTGHERFVYMHDFMPTNTDIYNWYMYGSTNQAEDEALITAFRSAMIQSN